LAEQNHTDGTDDEKRLKVDVEALAEGSDAQ